MSRLALPWLLGGRSPQQRPGLDRRAVLIRAHAGRPSAGEDPPRVDVVGGGIAGVSAAVALAERGVRVRLHERHEELGGRLRGWPTDHDATMTRGFHAFFRQYYNLRSLLRRVDPELGMLAPIGDYPLRHISGAQDTFVGLPRTPPWNAAGFMLRSPTFSLRELAAMNTRAAAALFDISSPRTYAELDQTDADTFLRELRFPEGARHLAFEVFSRSFFAHPSALSAAELAMMFHIYFLGSSEGLLFDVPRNPYPHTLWTPLHAYLLSLGAEVRLGSGVEHVHGGDGAYTVHAGQEFHTNAVVLAADVRGLRAVVAASPELGTPQWRTGVLGLATAPPFLVSRLWLDRPARRDRPAFLGTSGYDHLDNISVVDLFEGEASRWRRRTGGSVIELHAYALPENPDQDRCVRALIAELHAVYPELRGARVLHEEHVLAADCPLFAPGTFATRPAITTEDPGLVVAGDHTRVDLPVALMERAATSGFLAANALLSRWDLAGHDLWSVPNHGRWAALGRRTRRLAGLTAAEAR